MTTLESKMDGLVQTSTRIESTLESVATKNYVLTTFVIALLMFFLSLAGHAAIRAWLI